MTGRLIIAFVLAGMLSCRSSGMVAAQQPAAQQPAATRYWNTSWSLDSIDAGKLNSRLKAIGIDSGLQIEGTVSVEFDVGIPINDLRNAKAYRLSGTLTSPNFGIEDIRLADFTADVKYADGLLRLADLETRFGRRGSIAGRAQIEVTDDRRFAFEVKANDVTLDDFSESFGDANWVDGKLDLVLSGDGKLGDRAREEMTWRVGGRVASPSLAVAGVDVGLIEHRVRFDKESLQLTPLAEEGARRVDLTIGRVDVAYRSGERAIDLDIRQAELFGGNLSGTAQLGTEEEADSVLDVEVDGVRPTWSLRPDDPSIGSLAATMGGRIRWTVDGSEWMQPTRHSGSAELRLGEIELAGENVGGIEVAVAADGGNVRIRGDGRLLGGSVSVDATAEFQPGDEWTDFVARADLRTSKLIIGGTEIGNDLRGRLSWSDRTLTVGTLSGGYAGGQIRVAGKVVFEPDADGLRPDARLDVRLVRINVKRGLVWLGESVTDPLDGTASGHFAVTTRGEIAIHGRLDAQAFRVGGVSLGGATTGVSGSVAWDGSNWRLRFRDVRSEVGRGRLVGEATLSHSAGSPNGFDLQSRWRADRVDLVRFARDLGSRSSIASGEVSGRVRLGGRRIVSTKDLSGRFDLKLGDTRGAAIPGLVSASRFLGPLSLANTEFDAGQATGIVQGGVLVLQEFWLRSREALVHADGRIVLANGAMDIEATIATGDFTTFADGYVQTAQQYALRSFLPTTALIDLTRICRDRTIVIDVLGTLSDPRVRLQPLATIREEAGRFLIREIIRIAAADSIDALAD